MFCSSCGKELPDNAKFCSYCGNRVDERQPEKLMPLGTVKLEDDALNANMDSLFGEQEASSHPYHDLGGFLKFIVYMGYLGVILIAAYACYALYQMNNGAQYANELLWSLGAYGLDTDSLMPVVMGFLLFVCALEIALLRFYGKIRRKESGFLLYYHKLSILSMIIIGIFSLYSHSRYGNLSYALEKAVGEIISPLVGMALYTLYFVKSVRVRTYMGSADYLRCDPLTKSFQSPIPADGTVPEYVRCETSDLEIDNKYFMGVGVLCIVGIVTAFIGLNGFTHSNATDEESYYSENSNEYGTDYEMADSFDSTESAGYYNADTYNIDTYDSGYSSDGGTVYDTEDGEESFYGEEDDFFEISSLTKEDYANALVPSAYNYYQSDYSSSGFSFYYPTNLYESVEHEYDAGSAEYGDIRESVFFTGSKGSTLEFYQYDRNDSRSLEEETAFLHDREISKLEEGADILNKVTDGHGKVIVTGWETRESKRFAVYDMSKIENGKVLQMKVSFPEYTSDEDKNLKGYVTENYYRLCGFSDSSKGVRSYEMYLAGEDVD